MTELVHVARPLTLSTLPDRISYAQELAHSALLPDSYKRQPANIFYAIEFGAMLGIGPMAAITGIHVIKGKPCASAGLIGALVRRAGHRLRVGYNSASQVGWAEIIRADDPDYTFRAEWTTDRAIKAGLCILGKDSQPQARDDKGRPTSWEKYTIAMKKHRAVTECARDACEEALFGLHYTPEELGADVNEEGEIIRATAERSETFADVPAAVVAGFRNRVLAAETRADLASLLNEMKAAGLTGRESTTDANGAAVTLSNLVTSLGLARKAGEEDTASGATDDQPPEADVVVDGDIVVSSAPDSATIPPGSWGRLAELLAQVPVLLDTARAKARLVGEITGRFITSASELLPAELAYVISRLEEMLQEEDRSDAEFARMMTEPTRTATPPPA
jgi:hypothetical protein